MCPHISSVIKTSIAPGEDRVRPLVCAAYCLSRWSHRDPTATQLWAVDSHRLQSSCSQPVVAEGPGQSYLSYLWVMCVLFTSLRMMQINLCPSTTESRNQHGELQNELLEVRVQVKEGCLFKTVMTLDHETVDTDGWSPKVVVVVVVVVVGVLPPVLL